MLYTVIHVALFLAARQNPCGGLKVLSVAMNVEEKIVYSLKFYMNYTFVHLSGCVYSSLQS